MTSVTSSCSRTEYFCYFITDRSNPLITAHTMIMLHVTQNLTCCFCAGIGSQRTTVGLVERRHKELIQERVGLQTDRDVVKHGGAGADPGGGGTKSCAGAERAPALLRNQRSLSPEGHRSSSLPPPVHRTIPTATPSTYSLW